MPDLRGLSARARFARWRGPGFMPRLAGEGFVTAQIPMAGTPLDPRRSVASAARAAARHPWNRQTPQPSMTVVDLLAALVTPALLSAPPVTPDALGRIVTARGVRLASRDARRGVRRVARAEGRRRAVRAAGRRARRRCGGCRDAEPRRPSQVPWVVVPDARLALALLADRLLRAPERRAEGRRHHRHQRQDDDRVSAAVDFRGGGHALRPARHRRLQPRTAGRDAPRTTPEAPDVQQMLRQMVDNGCAARGDGSVVARACAAGASTASRSRPASSRT